MEISKNGKGGEEEKKESSFLDEAAGAAKNVGNAIADGAVAAGQKVADYAVERSEPENKSLFPTLSLTTRVKCWAVCIILSFLLSVCSSSLIMSVLKGEIAMFGIVYTLSIFLTFAGSFFLFGPKEQLKDMFHEKRRTTTIIFLSLVLAVIICCCLHEHVNPFVLFILVIC